MAGYDDEPDLEPPPKLGERLARAASLAGGLLSIALVAGLGVWGYRLAVRDVTGVPVIRALEGPMRVAPQEPGGDTASYQGLAVNRVAAEGETAPPPDRLVLAPRPTGLSEEDLTAAALRAAAEHPASGDGPGAPGLSEAALDAAVQEALSDGAPEALSDAAPAALAANAAPEALAADAATEAVPAAVAAGAAPFVAGAEGGPDASAGIPARISPDLRPMPRPARVAPPPATALPLVEAAAVLAAAPEEIDPSRLKAGDRLVQLGAFDDAATARQEWQRLAGRFGTYLAGKSRVVQQAQSGGRTFFRLRAAGFRDDAEARRFCSALLAEQAACIPVPVR